MNDLESLIAKLAPVRNGVNGIERYNAAGLLRRIGVDEEDLQELLESGTLCPCGKGQKDVTGKAEVYPFKSEDLNALRRALVLEGLKAIAAENETEDSPQGEKAFCRAAEFMFAMERRNEPKSRDPVALYFAQNALRRARVVELEEPVLRGKLAADRYRKKIQDEDLNRRDANLGRAAAAGALAGAALRGKLKLGLIKRAAIGAGAGAAGVVAVRKATEGSKDIYGERSREAKRAESLPALAGLGLAGYGVLRSSKARLRAVKSRLGGLAKFEREFEIRRRPDGTLYDDDEQRSGFPVGKAGLAVGAVGAGVLGHRAVMKNYAPDGQNVKGAYRNAARNVIPDAKAAFGPTASALGTSLKKDVVAPLKRRIAPPWAKIKAAIAATAARIF